MTEMGIPAEWDITSPRQVETTAIATIYRVQSRYGDAALKLFHNGDAKNEADAPIWLHHMANFGAVEVLAATPSALLLRWLAGPKLGDLCRAGEDQKATEILAQVACRLLQAPPLAQSPFPQLSDWVDPLLEMRPPAWVTAADAADINRAKDTAKTLLASSPTPKLLHGDLHHDNILRCGDGWRVIDPKGVIGDPAYEVANAFPNPIGFADYTDPHRIAQMSQAFAHTLTLPEARIFGWALVKSALSLLWNDGNRAAQASDLKMLRAFCQHPLCHLAGY